MNFSGHSTMILLEIGKPWGVLSIEWYDWVYAFKDYTALVKGEEGKWVCQNGIQIQGLSRGYVDAIQ